MSAAPAVSACYGSSESDDLQAMVHDFIENDPLDPSGGIINDGPIPGKKLSDALQVRQFSSAMLVAPFFIVIDHRYPGSRDPGSWSVILETDLCASGSELQPRGVCRCGFPKTALWNENS